jgi:predicted transcriptional regulator of viral defense system
MNIANKIIKNKAKDQTVFTTIEIKQLCNIVSEIELYSSLIYATNKGYLYRISRGIYSINRDYSRIEFANKFRNPSYISLYTVLNLNGVVFQPYSTINIITNRSEEAEIDGQKYIYRKIKDEILLNPFGIIDKEGIHIATSERAICDKLYLDGDEFFDNLREINFELMKEINEKVYQNNKAITTFILKNTK